MVEAVRGVSFGSDPDHFQAVSGSDRSLPAELERLLGRRVDPKRLAAVLALLD
jgi:hypothetical protein